MLAMHRRLSLPGVFRGRGFRFNLRIHDSPFKQLPLGYGIRCLRPLIHRVDTPGKRHVVVQRNQRKVLHGRRLVVPGASILDHWQLCLVSQICFPARLPHRIQQDRLQLLVADSLWRPRHLIAGNIRPLNIFLVQEALQVPDSHHIGLHGQVTFPVAVRDGVSAAAQHDLQLLERPDVQQAASDLTQMDSETSVNSGAPQTNEHAEVH